MSPSSFTTLDLIVVVCVAIGALQGLFRGLSGEMARLLGAVCAFVGGALLHEPVGEWVASYTRLIDQQARIATYLVTVVATLILWALFHRLIKKLLQLVLNPRFDKITGVPAGMLRMTALVAVVCLAILIWPHAPFKAYVGTDSFFGRQIVRLVPAVQQQLEDNQINLPSRSENAAEIDENGQE